MRSAINLRLFDDLHVEKSESRSWYVRLLHPIISLVKSR